MVEKSEYGVFMFRYVFGRRERENVRVCMHTYAAGLCIYAASCL